MEIREIKSRVRAGIDDVKIEHQEGEAALARIESAEEEQSKVENRPTIESIYTWLSQNWRENLVRGILLNLSKSGCGARSGRRH